MGLGGVGLGGLLVGLGLTGLLAAGQPDYAVGCADVLRLGSEFLAGLGLRPVADT